MLAFAAPAMCMGEPASRAEKESCQCEVDYFFSIQKGQKYIAGI